MPFWYKRDNILRRTHEYKLIVFFSCTPESRLSRKPNVVSSEFFFVYYKTLIIKQLTIQEMKNQSKLLMKSTIKLVVLSMLFFLFSKIKYAALNMISLYANVKEDREEVMEEMEKSHNTLQSMIMILNHVFGFSMYKVVKIIPDVIITETSQHANLGSISIVYLFDMNDITGELKKNIPEKIEFKIDFKFPGKKKDWMVYLDIKENSVAGDTYLNEINEKFEILHSVFEEEINKIQ